MEFEIEVDVVNDPTVSTTRDTPPTVVFGDIALGENSRQERFAVPCEVESQEGHSGSVCVTAIASGSDGSGGISNEHCVAVRDTD